MSEPEVREQPGKKQTKHRSPAYPFISLRRAVELAGQFYVKQSRHAAPLSSAVDVWGFAPKSSGGLQTISALKQFGLLEEIAVNEARYVKLTDAALRIIQDEREISPDRDAQIKSLALLPKIYAEMWNKFGGDLPLDATVKFFLINEKKYNGAIFDELFTAYKDTIDYVSLTESDKVTAAEGQIVGIHEDVQHPVTALPQKGTTLMDGERELITGLLSKTATFRLIVRGRVGEKEIDRLIAKLQLDKAIFADPDGGEID